ncbi:TRAP transporter fused permease subunit [Roseiarcaceae bacterium H3SJ34-1]|uniref:TRAP transporter permease n=1 Tax=Terripilifer ovatus TaxID=3032367 RepID=UPI003AB9820F|nr:TRAP transporter fused permease subunit [Roseiarcaceae bacterium H3SJ34-1]
MNEAADINKVSGLRAAWNRFCEIFGETRRVAPQGPLWMLVAALSVVTVFGIGYLALFAFATQQMQISLFLLLLMPACFLTTTRGAHTRTLTLIDYALTAIGVVTMIYFVLNAGRYGDWVAGISAPTLADLLAGTALTVLTIELGRRTIGFGLTMTILVLLLYVWLGDLIPGSFRHTALDYPYFIEMQTIGTDGIFGSPLYVAASYAFLFVFFGNLYILSGGGQLFFDVGAALTGHMIGGPAKACVMSSGLYGSISGSPVADVATTGPVTIPIMKRIGISAENAAAIEATSSTGGSMLPPVMGAVAFVMADFTGIPYASICLFAALPALGYYLGIFTLVHFDAVRENQPRLPESDIVGMKVALANNWPSLVPIVVLIWLLVQGYSPAYVAAGSSLSVLAASWLSRNPIGPRKFVQACVDTCMSSVPLTAAVAASGIIIGAIELTGLSGKFTLLLFELSGGFLITTLFLAGVILLLLGTGMPTTGCYIMAVALLAPVLISKFGLPLMPVHMFFLFYACLSALTPPVAVANFAAAAIAGANAFAITWKTCQLAIGGFVLPFYFLFNTGILFQGSWPQIVSDSIVGFALVITCCIALHGYVRRVAMPMPARALFAFAACAMLWPNAASQYVAVGVSAVAFAWLYRAAVGAEATQTAAA